MRANNSLTTDFPSQGFRSERMSPETPPSGHDAPEGAGELRLSDILLVIRRSWLLILLASLVGTLAGVAWFLHSPKLYTAVATVELSREASSGVNLQDFSGGSSQVGSSQDFMLDVTTEQAVLGSDNTALTVMQQLNIMKDSPYRELTETPIGRASIREYGPSLNANPVLRDAALVIFQKSLHVTSVKNTRLLTVSFTDGDPARAARVANATIDAYLSNHMEARYAATVKASSWLNEQLSELKQRAEKTHQQVADFEKQNGITGLTLPSTLGGKVDGSGSFDSGQLAYQQLSELNGELTHAEVNRIAMEAVYKLTATGDPGVILSVSNTSLAGAAGGANAMSSTSKSLQLVQSLRSQESSLKVKLASAKVTYGPNNPILVEMQQQVDAIEQQLRDEVKVINEQARVDYQVAESQEDRLRQTVGDQQQHFQHLGNSLAELNFLQQEENGTRVLYQDLYNRLEEANIASGVKSSGVAVTDPARTPSRSSSPNLPKDAALGLCGGALLGLTLAGVRKAADQTLYSPENLDVLPPSLLLGIVPHFDSDASGGRWLGRGAKPALATATSDPWIVAEPKSRTAEAYWRICTSILLSSANPRARVLLVTSALPGDGKSVTAYNIAAAMAKQSASVVLIEADLRHPGIAQLAGIDGTRGLSGLLSSDVALDSVLQVHPQVKNLTILASGTMPDSPVELLSSERFAVTLQSLRSRFEYVIIDTPPVLLVADPLLIARHSDAIITVIRSGRLSRAVLKRLLAALAKPNTPILGYVLNDYDPKKNQDTSYAYEGPKYRTKYSEVAQ